ncbi:hypothetical protein FISHEDRAFT_33674 [Fistulina hepatica ATCC 64428]|uniref:CxC1-like cysteine cluster associated with KDZ transposases domain-containing protein n=1 Tax=Fistulina hepatica ATCC 64428 TaxID=1128425 RepID=A0A0D7AQY1_9AGAR|nr:hypothetical protein FISHEDRAFT_33674 [Fistulina hepatica ATCC 64428]
MPGASKKKKRAKVVYDSSSGPRRVTFQKINKTPTERERARRKELELLAGTFIIIILLILSLADVITAALPSAVREDYVYSAEPGLASDDEASETARLAFTQPAPGEEGFDFSHAGAEGIFHSVVHNILHRKHHRDPRTRQNRVQERVNSWRKQLSRLKRAYLHWKAHGPPEAAEEGGWAMTVCSLRGIRDELFQHTTDSQSLNEALAYHGVIGATPDDPRIAFTFHCLETYRQLHRACPRLSIEAFCRATQNLHRRPPKYYLSRQFSWAYDVYLDILRAIDTDVDAALNRCNPEIQAKLLCAPCMYRLEEDAPLRPSMLIACDGNNSLKLIDPSFRVGQVRLDDRKLPSFRFLEPEDVDIFKDDEAQFPAPLEGSTTTETTPAHESLDTETTAPVDDFPWLNANELDEEAQVQLRACAERWRAAAPDAKKKMFELFAVAGVFVTVCQHGHVLLVCDMIRSGEL